MTVAGSPGPPAEEYATVSEFGSGVALMGPLNWEASLTLKGPTLMSVALATVVKAINPIASKVLALSMCLRRSGVVKDSVCDLPRRTDVGRHISAALRSQQGLGQECIDGRYSRVAAS